MFIYISLIEEIMIIEIYDSKNQTIFSGYRTNINNYIKSTLLRGTQHIQSFRQMINSIFSDVVIKPEMQVYI